MNWKRAALTSLGLSLLFVVVYFATAWITALRSDVGFVRGEWERHIPFVPLMIVPYMSIDLFFVAAPFFCRDDRQRRTLARRIAAAILVAGAFFLVMPLSFSFDRPMVDGWLGAIFDPFRSLDPPFNQFPSLHIALGAILLGHFARQSRSVVRAALFVWFALIAASALLTYQHHFIDVVGGFALALVLFHVFKDEPLRQPMTRNARVGSYYAIGAALLVGAAFVARPWSLFLLWPALSLALVAASYVGLGPNIYRKRDGRVPITAWLLFWPVLIGQWLSLRHYARRCAAWDRVTDRVWIGRVLSNDEATRAARDGVGAVLDLTPDFAAPPAFRALAYKNLRVVDLTAPTVEQLGEAVAWIDEQSKRSVVYVHCKIGYSRSAAVVAAHLLRSGAAASVDEALAMLRAARPSIVVRKEVIEALQRFVACQACGHQLQPLSS